MKRREVVFTPRAEADLEWLYDIIADAGFPDRALEYTDRVRAFCAGLDIASERGQRRDEIRPGLRVTGFERRVTIAFVVEDERVVILRLFYGGADCLAALRSGR